MAGEGGGEIGSIKETVTRDPFEENFVFCGSGTRRYKNNAKSELSHEILFYDASAPISFNIKQAISDDFKTVCKLFSTHGSGSTVGGKRNADQCGSGSASQVFTIV